jgi:2-polyprenyl-3-methyl-5-hydroxy-6-metoxy-1,4-benzoquinol methylase
MKPIVGRPSVAKRLAILMLKGENALDAWGSELLVHAHGGVHPKHALMNFSGFFLEKIQPTDNVLDVGCGRGIVAAALSTKARHVTGIDFEQKNIDFAKSHYNKPNLSFVHGDALKDLPNQQFDVVILSSVLEHIDRRVEFLKQLQPLGKKLLIRVPLITRDWKPLLKQSLGIEYRLDKTHFTEYREEDFEREIAEGGWKIAESRTRFGEIWAVVVRP